jgi:DNA-binding CsgD family transcriptional regulator
LRGRLRAVHAAGRDVGSLPSTDDLSAHSDARAILSPEGKLLHADGAAKLAGARQALQAAVRDIERARTSSRDDVERALNLWKGLVSARWTVVDEFDTHGEKYIVARENPVRATSLSKLTPTERCVVTCVARGFSTKEVAYTLGINDATVRVLLMRAARRYGVRGRRELLKLEPRD